MSHTKSEILKNQSEFKEEIYQFLRNDMKNTMEILDRISTDDAEIASELGEFKSKMKKLKAPDIKKLFIGKSATIPRQYAWWDEEGEEVIICKHDETI